MQGADGYFPHMEQPELLTISHCPSFETILRGNVLLGFFSKHNNEPDHVSLLVLLTDAITTSECIILFFPTIV